MACGDVLSLEDLQTAKKHQIFEAEVITGKAGGVAGGAIIDYATNPVTGQTQQTLPSILADLGFDVQSWTSSTGGVLASANQVFLNDTPGSLGRGDYYAWGGTFPKTVPAGTDPALVGSGYIMRSSRLAGVQAREALRRSYAEAGFNLVDGSFEAGGTLVNANDVLLQERTGKAFSGPAGTVAAGTNPASGGFVDKSGVDNIDQVHTRTFPNVDAMLAFNSLVVGQRYSTGGTIWRVNGTAGSTALTFIDLGGGLGAFPLTDVLVDDFGADNKGVADSAAALNHATSYKFKVKLSSGTYKLDSQWTIADLTCESITGAGKSSTSIISSQTTGVAMLVETFHTRALVIKEFTLRNSESTNTATGIKVQTTFGDWGGSVNGVAVNVTGFYGICLHLVGAFNVTMYDCLLQCLSNGTDTKGTILRTDKSSGTFGNQCSFTNTVFWGARIGIDNQGISPLAFRSCTFEALNLFNTSPAVTGLSIIQSYHNCWFENIQKGLVNCEIDYETLLPINISTTRSSILRFEFTNNIASGTQPTKWLNASVEPYYVNNFTATHGLRETLNVGAYQNKFEFSNGEDPTNPALRLIAQNVNVGSVVFRDNVLKHGVLKLVVRVTGLNGATMSAIFEGSTYGTNTSLIGVVRDDSAIGSDYKISASTMDASLNITVRAYGLGVHKLEVLYSSIS